MCLPFTSERVGSSPSKGRSKDLCCFFTLFRDRASKHGVSKGRVGQPLIAKHAVICQEVMREHRIKACSNTFGLCSKWSFWRDPEIFATGQLRSDNQSDWTYANVSEVLVPEMRMLDVSKLAICASLKPLLSWCMTVALRLPSL